MIALTFSFKIEFCENPFRVVPYSVDQEAVCACASEFSVGLLCRSKHHISFGVIPQFLAVLSGQEDVSKLHSDVGQGNITTM